MNRLRERRVLWVVLGVALLVGRTALADEPVQSVPNECRAGGQGAGCATNGDCAGNSAATLCVKGVCEIPCDAEEGGLQPDGAKCGMGETCAYGEDADLLGTYYCHRSNFTMDLNLLDSCLLHFLEWEMPDLSAGSACALESNLNRLLNQDQDNAFTIFDVDLCIQSFLDRPVCALQSPEDAICIDGNLHCEADIECGDGLFCDTTTNACQRECGIVSSREIGDAEFLDRECSGFLKTCEYDRGRCATVDLDGRVCMVDSDCPMGAHCFLGECAPKCYRNIDCPDSNWYCSETNRCAPLPPVGEVEGQFDPRDYSLIFSKRNVGLDLVANEQSIPVLIMSLATRKQVVDDPRLVFGYRLETSYGRKQDPKCTKDPAEWSTDEKRDCLIDDTEEFLTLLNPFGLVYGSGKSSIDVALNGAAAEALSPGVYPVVVTATFSNGSRTTFNVAFHKKSMNGEYVGNLSVYLDSPDNLLGHTNLALRMSVAKDEPMVAWHDFLVRENLTEALGEAWEAGGATAVASRHGGEEDLIDITPGYPVTGYLHGNSTMAFNWPGADSKATNEIPVKGIYSPEYNQLRLVGIIDIEDDFCWSDKGECGAGDYIGDDFPMRAENLFGRKIRRFIQFVGPYDDKARMFHGLFREKITGITASPIQLEGGFRLTQSVQNDAALLNPDRIQSAVGAVGFPGYPALLAAADQAIATECFGEGSWADHFVSKESFVTYLNEVMGADRSGAAFADMVRLEEEINDALGVLDSPEAALTIYDYLKGRIFFCGEGGEGEEESCIDEGEVRCGLALYRKALLKGDWVDLTGLSPQSNWIDYTAPVNAACPASAAQASDFIGDGYCDPEYNLSTCNFDGGDCCSATCVGAQCGEAGFSCADPGVLAPIGPFPGEHVLFCSPIIETASCAVPPAENHALVTLQEHNRFYRELVNALSFEAGDDLSEGFFTLYRHGSGDGLDGNSAFVYKRDKLVSALGKYNTILEDSLNPVSTEVLFNWPMGAFAGKGSDWIKQIQGTVSGRLDTLLELVDLKRRVLFSSGIQDYVFVQHLLQQEYLIQAYLIALEKEWKGEEFLYSGAAADVLEQGQILALRVDDTRNPLGIFGDQIFFGNLSQQSTNWEAYRDHITAPDGELVRAQTAVTSAIENLQSALRSDYEFHQNIVRERQQFEQRIDQLCGPDEDVPKCIPVSVEESEFQLTCDQGDSECLYDYRCSHSGVGASETTRCDDVYRFYKDATDTASLLDVACHPETEDFTVDMGTTDRQCVRGEMGALLQEKLMLGLQRRSLMRKVNTLLGQIAAQEANLRDTRSENSDMIEQLGRHHRTMEGFRAAIWGAELVTDLATTFSSAPDCVFIVGFAGGTDCIGNGISVGINVAAVATKYAIKPLFEKLMRDTDHTQNLYITKAGQHKELRGQATLLDNLTTEVMNLISEYEMLTSQLANVEVRLADTQYLARQAAKHYRENLGSAVEYLIGGQANYRILRNDAVKDAGARFQELLLMAYKMTMAFVHRYNLKDRMEEFNQNVFTLMTPEDVEDYITTGLNQFKDDYCQAYNVCDELTNVHRKKISLRETLFPYLRDKIDPRTGKVLSKGEQFHDLLLGEYVKRRAIAGGNMIVDRIEIDFAVWLDDRSEANPEVPYMLNPTDCLHIITGSEATGRTVGVNVWGRLLGPELTYQLQRGSTDYLSSCHAVGDGEFPINAFTIGYSPENALARMDEPPSFVYASANYSACMRTPADPHSGQLADESCYKKFARGRSLSAPDYRLTIPLYSITGMGEKQDFAQNMWVLGEGLSSGNQPVIEDIEVWINYSKLPKQN